MQETQVWFLSWEDPLEKEMHNAAPVFLPGKSHGPKSLVGYSLQGHKESDMTEQLHFLSLSTFNMQILQNSLLFWKGLGTKKKT